MRSWSSFARTEYGDEDLPYLINRTAPEHAEAISRFRSKIERVDLARYAIMHEHGSVYADADQQLISPQQLRRVACAHRVVLPIEMVVEVLGQRRVRRFVAGQSLLISPARHRFWPALIRFLVARYDPRCYEPMNTGPVALTAFVNGLCAAASATPLRADGAHARALLANVTLDWKFGDGHITRHHTTGHWRTWHSRAHQRANLRACSLDYVALDRERCAGYMRDMPNLPPDPKYSEWELLLTWIGVAVGLYLMIGTIGRRLAQRC